MAKYVSKRIIFTEAEVAGLNLDTMKVENRNAVAYGKGANDMEILLSAKSDNFMPAKIIKAEEKSELRKMSIEDFMTYSSIVNDSWKKAKGIAYIFRTMKKSKVKCSVLNPENSAIEEKIYFCNIVGSPTDNDILSAINKDLFKSGKHTSEKYAFAILGIETEETKRAITLSMFMAKSTLCTKEEEAEAEEADE